MDAPAASKGRKTTELFLIPAAGGERKEEEEGGLS